MAWFEANTRRFVILAATVELAFGIGFYTMPLLFQTPLWSTVAPARYFSATLVSGAVFLILQSRYAVPTSVRRMLFGVPALGFVWMGLHASSVAGWPFALIFSVMVAATLAVPWLNAGSDKRDLGVIVVAAILAVYGSAMMLPADDFVTPLHAQLGAGTPYAGLLGLVSAGVLLLPSTQPGTFLRWAPGSAFMALLGYAYSGQELSSAAVLWTVWAVILLSLRLIPASGTPARKEPSQGWEAVDAYRMVRFLETLAWLLVLAVVWITAIGGAAAVRVPGLSSLFVGAVVGYQGVALSGLALSKVGERWLLVHIIFHSLILGLLLVDGGYLSDAIIIVATVLPLAAGMFAGLKAGRFALAFNLAVVAAAECAQVWLGAESWTTALGELLVRVVVLAAVGYVGLWGVQRTRQQTGQLREARSHLQRQLQQTALLNQIARAIHSSLDLDQVLMTTVEEVRLAVKSSRCLIRLPGDEGRYPIAHESVAPGVMPVKAADDGLPGALPLMVETQGIMAVSDTATDPRLEKLTADQRDSVARSGIRAFLATPVRVGAEVAGILYVHECHGPREWTDDDRAFIEAVTGQVASALAQARTHKELRKREEALRVSEALFRSAFEHAPMGVGVMGLGGQWVQVNRFLCELLGYTEAELLDTSVWDLASPDDRQRLLEYQVRAASGQLAFYSQELRLLHRDGHVIWTLANASLLQGIYEKSPYFVVQIQDMTQRMQFEAELAFAANHDALTGLLNRRGFLQQMEEVLAAAREHRTAGALLFMDLDQFKYVNDSLGHKAGDELLAGLGSLLRGIVRPTDTLARLSGDEFALLLPHASAETAGLVAERILNALRYHATMISGQPVTCSVSIGGALFPDHGVAAEELLGVVDVAMYRAKERGRNRFQMYEPDDQEKDRIDTSLRWERKIRTALEEDRFVLFGQPILDLRQNVVSRYELLLRMVDRDGTMIPPGAFLEIAEQFGLINAIDKWVVRKAIELLGEAARSGNSLCLEVNLSGKTLNDPELLALLAGQIALTQIDPSALILEITETAAIADMSQALRMIEELKRLGIQFAMDDFGAGFSSLFYLKHLPVDYLKIDGAFVRNMARDPRDQHMVKAIVEVARGLGRETIAEFVEDGETLDLLRTYGVDYAQGYHVGRPGPLPVRPWQPSERPERTPESTGHTPAAAFTRTT